MSWQFIPDTQASWLPAGLRSKQEEAAGCTQPPCVSLSSATDRTLGHMQRTRQCTGTGFHPEAQRTLQKASVTAPRRDLPGRIDSHSDSRSPVLTSHIQCLHRPHGNCEGQVPKMVVDGHLVSGCHRLWPQSLHNLPWPMTWFLASVLVKMCWIPHHAYRAHLEILPPWCPSRVRTAHGPAI